MANPYRSGQTIGYRKKELYSYGIVWGVLTFVTGVGMTLAVLPEQLKAAEVASWKLATWVWLNAHGLPISEQAVSGSALSSGQLDFIGPIPELHLLRVIPLFLGAFAAVMVVNSMDGVRDDSQLLEYSIVGAGGYIFAGLIAIVLSEAQPGIILIIAIMGVLGAAAYLGGRVANRLHVPVFAVTSIGGIVGIGLLVLFGAGAVLSIAIPLGKYAIGGALGGAVAVWIGNNIDI